MNGQLEFYNVDESETMATGEHFMCTDIEWDPTGRYVATVVTSVHQMENGFNVWSWNGQPLYRCRASQSGCTMRDDPAQPMIQLSLPQTIRASESQILPVVTLHARAAWPQPWHTAAVLHAPAPRLVPLGPVHWLQATNCLPTAASIDSTCEGRLGYSRLVASDRRI